jgi:hypothetical protein
MSVFVLDKRQRPLMPCSEKRARKMLEAGRARIHRVMPFTIRLRDRHAESSALQFHTDGHLGRRSALNCPTRC